MGVDVVVDGMVVRWWSSGLAQGKGYKGGGKKEKKRCKLDCIRVYVWPVVDMSIVFCLLVIVRHCRVAAMAGVCGGRGERPCM